MPTDSLRLFVALDLPERIVTELGAVQARLGRQGLSLRWVRPANIHLTLKFLGDTPASAVAAISQILRTVAQQFGSLMLRASSGGTFPNSRRPRVMWCGLEGDLGSLAALQAALEERLATIGFDAERRPFRAHLTLGRFKGRPPVAQLTAALQTLAAFESTRFKVHRLGLYQSLLNPDGVRYVRLLTAPLEAGSCYAEDG